MISSELQLAIVFSKASVVRPNRMDHPLALSSVGSAHPERCLANVVAAQLRGRPRMPKSLRDEAWLLRGGVGGGPKPGRRQLQRLVGRRQGP